MAKTLAVFECDTSIGAIGVPIPSPVTAGVGAEIVVKDVGASASTNNITITPTTGLIDGAATLVISADSGAAKLLSDGEEWLVVSAGAGGGGGGEAENLITGDPVTGFFARPTTGDAGIEAQDGSVTIQSAGVGSGVSIGSNDGGDVNLTADNDANILASGSILVKAFEIGGSLVLAAPDGPVMIQPLAADLIAEYGGTGSAQSAAIPAVAGGAVIDAEARTALNSLLAYLRLRGTIHA